MDLRLDGVLERNIETQFFEGLEFGLQFLREQFDGDDLIGQIEVAMVTYADVVVPTVRFLHLL
jgi:hypothetical protein